MSSSDHRRPIRATQIFRWLHAVKADRRLNASCAKVALQLTDKTSEAEFKKSGTLTTWQSELAMAAAIGRCERTARNAIKLMERYGYLLIKAGHGRGRSNRYTLTLPNRQEVAAYGGSDSGKELPVSNERKRQAHAPIPASFEPESGKELPPNYSNNHSSNYFGDRDSDDASRGPRQRADALGPLATLDADLRQRLGENAKWLILARVEGLTDRVLTLSVPTPHQRAAIIKNCRAQLLELAGATSLKFVGEIAADDPPKAGRR